MSKSDPLAVYRSNKNSARGTYLQRPGVIKKLNKANKAVYFKSGCKMRFDKSWTLHSIQIGATALLFARFRDKQLLKIQLRWDSNKWRDYIRYTPILAALHSKALVDVNTDNLTAEFNKLHCK